MSDDHHCFQSAFHRGNGCYDRLMNRRASNSQRIHCRLSVRFSSRQWLLPSDIARLSEIVIKDFQSAFHRGNGCYRPRDQ